MEHHVPLTLISFDCFGLSHFALSVLFHDESNHLHMLGSSFASIVASHCNTVLHRPFQFAFYSTYYSFVELRFRYLQKNIVQGCQSQEKKIHVERNYVSEKNKENGTPAVEME